MSTPASELLITRLSEYLGPIAARSTVNTFCKRTVGVAPEQLSTTQLAMVLPSFKGILSVLLGTSKADAVVAQLGKDLAK